MLHLSPATRIIEHYPRFQVIKTLPKPFFVFKTHKFAFKKVSQIVRPNWQVWCRMIWKNVKNVSNNIKDGGLNKWIIVVDNSPIIFRILINVAIPLLQSDELLNSTENKAMNRAEQNNWPTSHDVSSLSLILYLFPVSGTFLKGKRKFLDGRNSRNVLGDTFNKFIIIVNYTHLKTKIRLRFQKIRVIYTFS